MFSSIVRSSMSSAFRPQLASRMAGLAAWQQQPRQAFSSQKEPVRVSVTGAAGQIGYALLFRIASGALLGPDQPVILQCIELPHAMNALKGVAMELDDCAFPLLQGVVQTDSLEVGFEGADIAMLVGSKPRGPGMERGDLLKDNGAIFTSTGKAMDKTASKNCKTVVVGNPANTNCLILSENASSIPKKNFTALTKLDHFRAVAQLSERAGAHNSQVENVIIWGNHSATQYPDISNVKINGESPTDIINDSEWINNTFIPDVQTRGAAIIDARGQSSAASAANGAVEHIKDWVLGTNGKITSMAVPSDGSYGIEEGIIFSYPVICNNGEYEIVQGLTIPDQGRMDITEKELREEREAVAHML